MPTKARLPRIPAPWLPGAYLAVGILAGCVLGPLLYRLLLHDLSFESITAVSTVALAVATVYLGVETRRLAAESVRTEYQSERQHQQTMTPVLKLSAPIGIAASAINTNVHIGGHIANRGSGPAFDIRIEVENPRGDILHVIRIEPLGVGEEVAVTQNITSDVIFQRTDDWKIRLLYDNLFGSTAMTVYRGTSLGNPHFVRPPIVLATPEGIKTVPVVEKA